MKILFFALAAIALWQNINADYRAAVVEYTPLFDSSVNTTVETNIKEYISHIERAKASNVDIIVFPEYGLTGLIEDPTESAIEIPGNVTEYQNDWLRRLSNTAKEHSMYVVVNLLEKDKNEKNDTIYFNTNIVFDRAGVIIAKYRKINLYFEPKLTPGTETVTFATDFGIVFGLFTCADILYYNPSRSIVTDSVTNIIFTAAWTSTLPFYHSLSVEAGYSQANRVNLLAANLNNPSKGLSGSGIYGHDGTVLSYYISGISSSKLLISDLKPRGAPKDPVNGFSTFGFDILNNNSKPELDNFIYARDFQSSRYQFKQLDFSQGQIEETVCQGSHCCTFRVTASFVNSTEIYQFVVYDGPSQLGSGEGNIKVCAIVSCESSSTSSCGTRNVTLTNEFSEISISGDFPSPIDHFYQPVTLTTNFVPVLNTTFDSVRVNESISISFNTTQTAKQVVVFGIYGRGAASTFGSSFIFLIALSVIKFML